MNKVSLNYDNAIENKKRNLSGKNHLLAAVKQTYIYLRANRKARILRVRFGFKMEKGRYVLPADIVARVRDNVPEQASLLIKTTEKVTSTALKQYARIAWKSLALQ